ncbi:MAG: phosphotransferase [Dehalococcoidia bacterium]|nr:phosphotransferase [Dehalococcoidia bacterium]
MDDRIENIMKSVELDTFLSVARAALDNPNITSVQKPSLTEITTSHNDQRTIGIVKVSGVAIGLEGQRRWSSVAKIIDSAKVSGDAARWLFPENERKIYELGLFQNDGIRLRPAKCYLVDDLDDDLSVLWLEDLSEAPQPPWSLDQFTSAAANLAQFNGFHLANDTELPVSIQQDAYYLRNGGGRTREQYAEVAEMRDNELVDRVYRDVSMESALEFAALYEKALEKAKELPHSICFGDSHARNMFPIDSQTVGIDWASITRDPIGVDVGVLAGSPLTFGAEEAQLSADHEQVIFDAYLSSLADSEWTGKPEDVRVAFFCQFAGYISIVATIPLSLDEYLNNPDRRAFLLDRFGVTVDDLPERLASVMTLIPKYVEELRQLVG